MQNVNKRKLALKLQKAILKCKKKPKTMQIFCYKQRFSTVLAIFYNVAGGQLFCFFGIWNL